MESSGLRHSTPKDCQHRQKVRQKIKFMIFDASLVKGTYKYRLARLDKEIAKNLNEVVEIVK